MLQWKNDRRDDTQATTETMMSIRTAALPHHTLFADDDRSWVLFSLAVSWDIHDLSSQCMKNATLDHFHGHDNTPLLPSGIVPGIAIPDEYIEQPHPVSFSMRRSRRLRLSYHAITDVRWILAGADAGVEPRTQLSVSAPVVKGAQCSTKAGRTQ